MELSKSPYLPRKTQGEEGEITLKVACLETTKGNTNLQIQFLVIERRWKGYLSGLYRQALVLIGEGQVLHGFSDIRRCNGREASSEHFLAIVDVLDGRLDDVQHLEADVLAFLIAIQPQNNGVTGHSKRQSEHTCSWKHP